MRRELEFKLLDNNVYKFAERNREDADIYAVTERLRSVNLKKISNDIANEDDRITLLISEMKRVYLPQEIMNYAVSYNEILKTCFDSFKLFNNKSIDDFKLLVDDELLNKISNAIYLIENDNKKKVVEENQSEGQHPKLS
jgi:hypothetical protein